MFLLRDKLITQGEKWETLTKTCNERMLLDKLRVLCLVFRRLTENQGLSSWVFLLTLTPLIFGKNNPFAKHMLFFSLTTTVSEECSRIIPCVNKAAGEECSRTLPNCRQMHHSPYL